VDMPRRPGGQRVLRPQSVLTRSHSPALGRTSRPRGVGSRSPGGRGHHRGRRGPAPISPGPGTTLPRRRQMLARVRSSPAHQPAIPDRDDDHAPLPEGTARPPARAGTAPLGSTTQVASAPPAAPIGQEPRRMGAHRDRPRACLRIRRCVTPGKLARGKPAGKAGDGRHPAPAAAGETAPGPYA
jgi:hypothetical protein